MFNSRIELALRTIVSLLFVLAKKSTTDREEIATIYKLADEFDDEWEELGK